MSTKITWKQSWENTPPLMKVYCVLYVLIGIPLIILWEVGKCLLILCIAVNLFPGDDSGPFYD